jgi:hypothetical protein
MMMMMMMMMMITSLKGLVMKQINLQIRDSLQVTQIKYLVLLRDAAD